MKTPRNIMLKSLIVTENRKYGAHEYWIRMQIINNLNISVVTRCIQENVAMGISS